MAGSGQDGRVIIKGDVGENHHFTSLEPLGFGVLCQLAQKISLLCGFCPSARTFELGLPSDGRSTSRPCLWLVLLVVFMNMNIIGSRKGDVLDGEIERVLLHCA
jgi:hypothetical protein